MHIENEKKSFLCIVTRKKKNSSSMFFPCNKLTLHCISSSSFFCEASLHCNSFFCATRKKKSLNVVASACSKKNSCCKKKKKSLHCSFLFHATSLCWKQCNKLNYFLCSGDNLFKVVKKLVSASPHWPITMMDQSITLVLGLLESTKQISKPRRQIDFHTIWLL